MVDSQKIPFFSYRSAVDDRSAKNLGPRWRSSGQGTGLPVMPVPVTRLFNRRHRTHHFVQVPVMLAPTDVSDLPGARHAPSAHPETGPAGALVSSRRTPPLRRPVHSCGFSSRGQQGARKRPIGNGGEIRGDRAFTGDILDAPCQRRKTRVEMLARLHHDPAISGRLDFRAASSRRDETPGCVSRSAPTSDAVIAAQQPDRRAHGHRGLAEALPSALDDPAHLHARARRPDRPHPSPPTSCWSPDSGWSRCGRAVSRR